MFWQVYVIQVYKWGGAENADKNYCKYKCNCLCLIFKMAAPGQNPRSENKSKEMVTTAITKGKQNKVVGKMSAIRVSLCVDVTIKENNTIYIIKGQKSNPALCTRRFPGRVAEVFYKSGAGS